MIKSIITALFVFSILFCFAKEYPVSGQVKNKLNSQALSGVEVEISFLDIKVVTDSLGKYLFPKVPNGAYTLYFMDNDTIRESKKITVKDAPLLVPTVSLDLAYYILHTVAVVGEKNMMGLRRLRGVEGTAIYEGKKNEVIVLEGLNLSLGTNSSRQLFAKVPGMNIWESDAAGLQLGVATRGLDPNRTSNFNTRQNGYDMSADALGYPESYYVPPAEAVAQIEVVRGAASLQYGSQFGGMLNYVLKKAPKDKKIEWNSYTTAGAYKLVSSFNSIGGTIKCVNYYGYYNYKQGAGWRPNSNFKLHNAYASIGYQCTERLSLKAEFTFSNYVAQQPGGLTDIQFESNPRQSMRSRNWFSTNWNILALSLNYKYNNFHQFNLRTWGFLGSRYAVGNLSAANRVDDISKNRDLIKDRYKNLGVEARYVWKYYIKKNLSSLLLGGRFYTGVTQKIQGFGNADSDANFGFASPNLISSDFQFPGMNVALFSENVFTITPRFKLIPGIRFEHISTKAKGYYRQTTNEDVDSVSQNESRSFKRSFVLLGLGATFKTTQHTELYANFSQNYRGITFTDMRVVRINQKINPNLKDETGFNLDVGYRGNIGRFIHFDVSGFWLQYNNRIGQIQQVDSAYNIFRYTTNIGKSRSLGIELFGEVDFLSLTRKTERFGQLVMFVSTGFTNAVYTRSSFPNVVGKFLEAAPQLTFRSGISYTYKSFSTTIQGAYTSLQYTDATNALLTPTAINGQIPAFYTLDFSAKYAIKCVQLIVGVNNFTNNKYYTRRAVSYPGPGIIPAEPITIYATVGFRLNELAKKNKFNTFK